ncbi:tRNA (adenosine(37)-N6)-threonylcarbamoyltransferase complex dimerization subunit type 1 TsaB [uncultured Brevundimonas sp.]|uniref:tRNA (adenosine(37)-N6)-threonylcarbamoyltransferase complex dimerization subunit type 1 TsaB n=1 Tax=uncultured Brevundimonas sp. TaxID=213418 RepID=UPI002631E69C|nr:tRNA (adenosine(37)-N6)-threonylcarbamoyltransferase complex dimerization subunit type 1 TsaB [uncultured Brevundimonas sp.]
MKLMVIDTALGACLAGCFTVEGTQVQSLGLRREEMTKGHQERLGGMARDAAADAGGLSGVERVGVTVGPGSFTGLRVGLSFALGLGAALGADVIGISTLDALAASVPRDGRVVAAIDARRGQVYIRRFNNGVAVSEAEALPIADAIEAILADGPADQVTIVGSGAPVLLEADERLGAATSMPLVAPSAEALARLTAELDPQTSPPKPIYLRAPDATPPTRLPGQPRTAAS